MKYEIGKSHVEFDPSVMDDTEIEIETLYVHPQERGRRMGYRLLDYVVKYARDNGYEKVGLCAFPDEADGIPEEALIEYYREYGFESDGDCDSLMSLRVA